MGTIPSVTVHAMLTFYELSVSVQTKAGFQKNKKHSYTSNYMYIYGN